MKQVFILNDDHAFDELGGDKITLKLPEKLEFSGSALVTLSLQIDDKSVCTQFQLAESLAKSGLILTGCYRDNETGEIRAHLLTVNPVQVISLDEGIAFLEVFFYEKVYFRQSAKKS